MHSVAAVEALFYPGEKADEPGACGGSGVEISDERPGTLVERGGLAYESGLSQEIL